MIYNYFIELRRNLLEFYHYKVNILFANIGFLLLFLGLINHIDQETNITLILLFTWYCSIHGLDSTAYILEDEIKDRTLFNTLSGSVPLLNILFMRNSVQLIIDLLKATIIFGSIMLTNTVVFDLSISQALIAIFLVLLSIIITYLIGISIGSFALVYKRVSSIPSVLYYVMLFFSGIVNDYFVISKIFPFVFLRNALASLINKDYALGESIFFLFIQLIIYLVLALIFMKMNLKKMYLKGKIAHV